MSTRTITATVPAWIGKYSLLGPHELRNGSDEEIINALTFVNFDMTGCGYTVRNR